MSEQDLEAAWQTLLPDNFYVSCGEVNSNYPLLTEIERNSFGDNLSNARLTELQAGRYHAKKALSKLNINIEALPKSKTSPSPDWPDHVKGSITHTRPPGQTGHVASVVTNAIEISHMGIDAEYFTELTPNMWRTFLSQQELKWVEHLNVAMRTPVVKKMWCLKESAIKAFSHQDMMAFSVHADTNNNLSAFTLTGADCHKIIKGSAIETNGITLALVYA